MSNSTEFISAEQEMMRDLDRSRESESDIDFDSLPVRFLWLYCIDNCDTPSDSVWGRYQTGNPFCVASTPFNNYDSDSKICMAMWLWF